MRRLLNGLHVRSTPYSMQCIYTYILELWIGVRVYTCGDILLRSIGMGIRSRVNDLSLFDAVECSFFVYTYVYVYVCMYSCKVHS